VRRVAIVLGLLTLAWPGGGRRRAGRGPPAKSEQAKQEEAKKAAEAGLHERGPRQGQAADDSSSSVLLLLQGRRETLRGFVLRRDRPRTSGFTDGSAARSRLAQVEARIQELQAKLNPMSTTFIYGGLGSNSLTEEAEVKAELAQSDGQLNEARQAVADATRALQDFRQGRLPSNAER
jgi:hypothetical protein